MRQKKRIGVIFGGRSGEHEVSLGSARSVVQSLDRQKYEVIPIAITQEGNWLWGVDPQQMIEANNDLKGIDTLTSAPRVSLITDTQMKSFVSLNDTQTLPLKGEIDVLFPVLHGTYGEDGTIQGLFEMANIPYVGCGVLGSAVGMDKEIMKILFHAANLPIVETLAYKRFQWNNSPEEVLDSIEQRLSYPCFVKPANLGSSVGVNKATDRTRLTAAIQTAFSYDRKIVIEQGLNCRELSCGILGNNTPLVSRVGEVLPVNEFNDYSEKYLDHMTQFDIPAKDLSPEEIHDIQTMAIKAYQTLNLNGLSRVDFFQDKDTRKLYINEVNTLPGFTDTSLYPRLWAISGLSYPDLLDQLIDLALESYEERLSLRNKL